MDSDVRVKPAQYELEEEGPLNLGPNTATCAETERLGGDTRDMGKQRVGAHGCLFHLTYSLLDSHYTTFFMVLLTTYALFGDDLRLAATNKPSDVYFFSLASVCFILFTLEIAAAFWVKPSYRFSFNFYLDLIATLSLIPDIGWLWQLMIGTQQATSSSQINQVQNAGKLSRTGARTSRVIKIVRLIRIIRLVKLYKSAKTAIDHQNHLKIAPESEYSIPEESKIGRKLSDLTTKRVIVIVMMLLIILPLFDLTFYVESYTSWECGGHQLRDFIGTEAYEITREVYIDYHKNNLRPLVFLSLTLEGDSVIWQPSTPPSLRLEESYYIVEGLNVAVFDIRYDTRLEAMLSMFRTVFICAVLSLGAVYLTKDANSLVIEPIEKMIAKVQKIAKNPVGVLEEDLLDIYDLEKGNNHTVAQTWWQRMCCISVKPTKELETSVLESSILKLGALLAISFGEAGARVIGENISKGDHVNPMLEGKKVIAIIGFCDIRNFTDTTEALQEAVMTFVNEIAYIVHHTVDSHLGMANKNVGDAFMVVWKFPEELCRRGIEEIAVEEESHVVRNLADLAVIAFVKTVSKINRNTAVLKYRENQELRKVMPGYSVRMGFALHCGWAIEGAIGSSLKIDASYLSPHVNIVLRMEELTKLYEVPVLVSGTVMRLASEELRRKCRHLDTVETGSQVVIRLYTYDIDVSSILPSPLASPAHLHSRTKHKRTLLQISDPSYHAYTQFEASKHLLTLPRGVTQDYIDNYNQAMDCFEQGKWRETRTILENCLAFKPVDVPTKVIMTFMKTHEYTPPPTWRGSRLIPR